MGTRCSGCGHVRIQSEEWPDWQCPACLLAYATSRKLARRSESLARTDLVRTRHRRQRRQYLAVMLILLLLQVGTSVAGGFLAPQLWAPAAIACALCWLPIGLFGIRRPGLLWLPLWSAVSGFAVGTLIGHFNLIHAAYAVAVTAAFIAIVIIVWALQGKTPKRASKAHRHSAIALAGAFFAGIPLVFFADIHPLAAMAATISCGLIVGWMQFRVYRLARFHAVREAMPLAAATMFDWMTPKTWARLWQNQSPTPEPSRKTGLHTYSGSENFGKRDSKNSNADSQAAPGTANAIDSRPLQINDAANMDGIIEQHGGPYRPQRQLRDKSEQLNEGRQAIKLKLVAGKYEQL